MVRWGKKKVYVFRIVQGRGRWAGGGVSLASKKEKGPQKALNGKKLREKHV